jgi:hypothetical protein
MVNAMFNQTGESSSRSGLLTQQINQKFAPLLKDGETMVFDLENRCLILTSISGTQVARLSRTEAHLLLALVYFCPFEVPDTVLAQGYLVDILSYYEQLEQSKIYTGEQEAMQFVSDAIIKGGIERLRKKVQTLGITIPRMLQSSYVLRRGTYEQQKTVRFPKFLSG